MRCLGTGREVSEDVAKGPNVFWCNVDFDLFGKLAFAWA